MIITVKAHTKSSQNKVELRDNIYHVYVGAPAQDNKANEAIIKLLANFFKTSKSNIIIKSGEKNNLKTIVIHET